MASLPIAATYREQQLRPIGVPGMARAESTQVAAAPASEPVAPTMPAPVAAAPGAAAPLMDQLAALPRAFATDAPAAAPVEAEPVPGQPIVGPAITPIKDGPVTPAEPVLAHVPGNLPAGVPMFQLQESQPVSLTTGAPSAATAAPAAAAKPAPVSGQEYVIASGDTLMKIAKKHYGSSKPEDTARIVAANPGYLKNAMTMLVVGRKLIIPHTAETVAASLRPTSNPDGTLVSLSDPRLASLVVIHSPGSKPEAAADRKPVEARKLTGKPEKTAAAPKKETSKEAGKEPGSHYVVQSGDTPERIARKFSGSPEYVKQLMSANKIKDARNLHVGMKLKLPAK
jgi:nucleoid-associated protein YgaU